MELCLGPGKSWKINQLVAALTLVLQNLSGSWALSRPAGELK